MSRKFLFSSSRLQSSPHRARIEASTSFHEAIAAIRHTPPHSATPHRQTRHRPCTPPAHHLRHGAVPNHTALAPDAAHPEPRILRPQNSNHALHARRLGPRPQHRRHAGALKLARRRLDGPRPPAPRRGRRRRPVWRLRCRDLCQGVRRPAAARAAAPAARRCRRRRRISRPSPARPAVVRHKVVLIRRSPALRAGAEY